MRCARRFCRWPKPPVARSRRSMSIPIPRWRRAGASVCPYYSAECASFATTAWIASRSPPGSEASSASNCGRSLGLHAEAQVKRDHGNDYVEHRVRGVVRHDAQQHRIAVEESQRCDQAVDHAKHLEEDARGLFAHGADDDGDYAEQLPAGVDRWNPSEHADDYKHDAEDQGNPLQRHVWLLLEFC